VNDRVVNGVFERAQDSTEFLAGYLPRRRHQELARALRLDTRQLRRLLLCRPPRAAHYVADTTAIAEFVGAAPTALAESLRQLIALSALDQYSAERAQPDVLLRAARDVTPEPYGPTTRPTSVTSLVAQVDQTRRSLPKGDHDIAAWVAWHSPVAVVVVPRLTLARTSEWLEGNGVVVPLDIPDRLVRGLLIAWRGSGLIFVDGALSRADRDLTIAHDWGHYLLDYQIPRARMLERAPGLLEVVDGYRTATREERIEGLLADVPIGLHTHFLERDGAGDAPWDVALHEDGATAFALELLAPWTRVLATLRGIVSTDEPFDLRLAKATQALITRFGLPTDAAEARARRALRALGWGPGFFER
jgi:hypothetical protein